MRRAVSVLGLLCSLVLIIAACGGDGGDQQAATDPKPTARTTEAPKTARTIPEPDETLTPGKYVTTKFEPGFSFRVVDRGWRVAGPEIPDNMDIYQPEPFILLSFVNPQKVYDPKKPAEEIVKPEPKDQAGWVAWFQNHPYLDTSKPERVSIGGVSGVQFESEVSSAPKNYPKKYCGTPCISAWPVSFGGSYYFLLGDKDQITILEVEGETVIIDADTLENEFEKLLPKAQKVLDTVEWKGAS